VPLDEVLIKLHPEGYHQAFEADAINVGAGGISMRASVLPQIGSTLRCQLDNPVGGEAIEMIGRVVWAHESGEHAGEFGIRFTHLSNDDQTRIEALIQRWGRTSATAPTVTLHLDGVDSAIVAELQSETETVLTVEQPLPFLSIGSGMVNASAGRRGHLEAVELRMDAETPKLVLSIAYEVLGEREADAIEEVGRDTMPDEPPVIRASRPSGEVRMHDTPRVIRYDRSEEDAARESIGDRLRTCGKSAVDQLATTAGSARSAVTEVVVPRAGAAIRDFFALISRFIGALRARLDEKPRRQQVPRSEAARAHLKNTRRSGRRYLMLAAMIAGIVAAGWGIYLWAAGSVIEAAAEPAKTPELAPANAPAPARASESAKASVSSKAAAIPVQGPPLAPEKVKGVAFGADAVPHGEKYVLRMSNPVVEMDGIVEEDGFSVTIPGSLSLSQAGPIAAAHPDVEHASILNRGDFSELTIRFVAGRRPAYRVEAHGPVVEITISR
jgi:hypothetical protein